MTREEALLWLHLLQLSALPPWINVIGNPPELGQAILSEAHARTKKVLLDLHVPPSPNPPSYKGQV